MPSDRTVVVERFRDEIGDWRVCILTPFGARVHAPWSMAIGARCATRSASRCSRSGRTTGSRSTSRRGRATADRGARHRPGGDRGPRDGELGGTALFGSRFRENAARALLIPRRRPGERTPALAAAAEGAGAAAGRAQVRLVPGHPRDLPGVPAGRLRPAGAEAAAPGPEDAAARPRRRRDRDRLAVLDLAPLRLRRELHVRGRHAARAERARQVLSLDRDLLKELLARRRSARADRPGALEEVEAQLRGARGTRTSYTTCSGFAATCVPVSTTRLSRDRFCASGARSVRDRRRGPARRGRRTRADTGTLWA